MEPTQSAGVPAPDQNQDHNTQPLAATADTTNSTGQNSADGKSWMEFASLQKVVDQLPQGVRDFCTNSWSQAGKSLNQVGEQVGKMSTVQKVAGAVALAGIGYLAMRSGKKSASHVSETYKPYRGESSTYRSPEKGSYGYSSSTRTDNSRRMDMRHSAETSSFDRQNATRVGGTYSSGSDSYLTGPNTSAYRGSQGSTGSSNSPASDDSSIGK
jgi:hypothetical protein